MAEQKFALFVSAVAGHLVPRPNSGGREYFGAIVVPPEAQAKGEEPIKWDEERVIPILPADAERFTREFSRWFRTGALLRREPADWQAWQVVEEKRESDSEAAKASATREESNEQ